MLFDRNELQEKIVPYWWIIGKALVCVPSNLLFMSCFGASRFESKLWDLKYLLAKNRNKENGEKDIQQLKTELNDFQVRYQGSSSEAFDFVLKTMLEDDGARLNLINHKYGNYFSAIVDWELIRVQPMRYIWNESEQIALYGLVFTGTSVILGFARWSVNDDKSSQKSLQLVSSKFKSLDTVDAIIRLKNYTRSTHEVMIGKYGIYKTAVSKLPTRLKFPFLVLNGANFFYLLGGYKRLV